MLKLRFIFLSMIFLSCTNIEIKKEYYPSGTLEAIRSYKNSLLDGESLYYSESGDLKKEVYYTKGKLDSIFFHNEKGIYQKEVKKNDSIVTITEYDNNKFKTGEGDFLNSIKRIGWWNYYDLNDGNLVRKVEFLNICNKEYANQIINFNENGDTLRYSDNCFYVNYKVIDEEPYYIINYDIKSLFKKSSSELCFLKSKVYCEPKDSELDTLIRIEKNKGSIKLSKKYNIENLLIFNYHFTDTLTQSDERNVESKKMYFNLEGYIVK